MMRFALMGLLCLLAGTAGADTFELADPAADMLKAQEVKEAQEAEEAQEEQFEPEVWQAPANNVLCTVDTETGACSCIDAEKAKRLTMTREECVERVLKSLKKQ